MKGTFVASGVRKVPFGAPEASLKRRPAAVGDATAAGRFPVRWVR
jgi:hypothetical protein